MNARLNPERRFKIYAKGRTHKCRGTAIPLQAWTGPEGSKRLRLPDFKAIGI
jgi:hypothetical protein